MAEKFVSEAIQPTPGTADNTAMVRGEPGLPGRFTWRNHEYEVATIQQAWKEFGPCRSGSGEQYLRKHWYKIETTEGQTMTLYFERQARSKRQIKVRWWLYTVE